MLEQHLSNGKGHALKVLLKRRRNLIGNVRNIYITKKKYVSFVCWQVKQAEKQAMIEGIRENGSEAAEFVIRKVREKICLL